jgi:ABC-2 type transport system ATP-binding protein
MVSTLLGRPTGIHRSTFVGEPTTFEDSRRTNAVPSVEPVIEVLDVSKRYGRQDAVCGLSFTVRPGHVTGFLGPNGAGKSTTMRMMLDLDRPTSGQILIDGHHYRQFAEPLRRVGALFEGMAAHRGRSAYHHLLWLAQSNRIVKSRVREVLAQVGLDGAASRRTRGFSLGMSQRLGIAAALLGDPSVLLLDEPVNGLDPQGILWIRNLMKALAAEGRTVFVSSHLMSEMALTAEHLIVIGRGRLLADTTVTEFIEANSRSYVRIRTPEPERMRDALTGAGVQVTQATDGALEAEGVPAAMIGELAATNGLTVHEITTQSSSLEAAFMRLTANATEHQAEGPR